ncbi:protein of unknown function [Psychroflexus salarius]|uniref:DUF4829 domain-containing protein n=1 Tax=Psychroflexus salarius TaxID=1155689 RepID=A0A1M4W2S1_9FLAO|nr:DUF4829 domain-containing protein [Psychroflexus salarius]SHE75561.1 protein of unknown function [Psychroflexus salarius]
MKLIKLLSVIVIFTVIPSNAQNTAEQTVNAFFEALNAKDVAKIEKLCLDNLVLNSLSVTSESSKLNQQNLKGFLHSLKQMPETLKIKEVITKTKSRDDNYIEHFWLEYEFYVNDKLSHKGVNSITLLKGANGWKISAITDTRISEK